MAKEPRKTKPVANYHRVRDSDSHHSVSSRWHKHYLSQLIPALPDSESRGVPPQMLPSNAEKVPLHAHLFTVYDLDPLHQQEPFIAFTDLPLASH